MNATQSETAQTVFVSRDPTYRLVRRPERRRYNERGELEILPGERYEFTNGRYETSDPDVIEWFRNHPKRDERFTEVGNEPDRERPSLDEAMQMIAEASVDGDIARLSEIYMTESDTYQRDPVLNASKRAIERLEEHAAKAVAEGDSAVEPVAAASEPEVSPEA